MEIFFFVIHMLIIFLLITGVLLQEAREEGFTGLGASTSSESPYSKKSKGWSSMLDNAVRYLAWAFLISAIVSSIFLPRIL